MNPEPEAPAPPRPAPTVQLAEWAGATHPIGDVVEAAGCSASEIAEALRPLVKVEPAWGEKIRFSAGGTVGELAIGDLFVRVVPHLEVGDLYQLFAWTRGIHLAVQEPPLGYDASRSRSFPELLALALIREVDGLLRTDLLRRWVRRDERLLLLRGRPRFEALGAAPPSLGVPCRFQHLSADVLENRLVRAGLHAAVWRLRGPVRRHALAQLGVFADLARLHHPDRTDYERARLDASPRTAAYRTALQLSEWLVLGGGPLSTHGAGGVSGWTLDMPRLFEQAVAQGVESWGLQHGLTVRPQRWEHYAILDGEGDSYASVAPDLEVLRGSEIVAVVDAKYKSYADGDADGKPLRKISRGDRYQLAFYGAAAGRKAELFVAVPSHREYPLANRWCSIRVAGLPVGLVEVDLGTLPKTGTIVLPLITQPEARSPA